MIQQFFGKPFWITLAALAVFFALSAAVFQTVFAPVLLVAVIIAVFILSWCDLSLGLFIAFAELFANSHGHLVSAELGDFSFSLRMAIFAAIMAVFFIKLIRRQVKIKKNDQRLLAFAFLAVAVLFGFMQAAPNGWSQAFADGNAYFYMLYVLPILAVPWDALSQRRLLQVLAASAIWVAVLSLFLLYMFTHLEPVFLSHVYKFIRDTRTGEMTLMAEGGFFRIFLPAQFSVLLFLFLLLPFFWMKRLRQNKETLLEIFLIGLCIAVALLSLSRSFWVGIIAGGIVFLILAVKFLKDRELGKVMLKSAAALVSSAVILLFFVLFPWPQRSGSFWLLGLLFSNRATEMEDVAISSRWQLLPPLWEEIKKQPIVGQGFGKEVEFITDDPRARAISPDGRWRTYALEWGYLELWLKMGLLGPTAFILLFIASFKGLLPLLKSERAWLGVGFLSALVFLYATHVFSPYLNHPLGLGFLLFLVPFCQEKIFEVEKVQVVSLLQNRSLNVGVAKDELTGIN